MVSLLYAALLLGSTPDLSKGASTKILVAGKPYDIGRPVVPWGHPQGFNAMETKCEAPTAPHGSSVCCDPKYADRRRYQARSVGENASLEVLQKTVYQIVLHHTGGVRNARATFLAMHDYPATRKDPSTGDSLVCPKLSAHFILDLDGTLYQTLDLRLEAYHARFVNEHSIGVEIVNAADYDRFGKLPEYADDYGHRDHRPVTLNGSKHNAYEYTPAQYETLSALIKTLRRVFPRIEKKVPGFSDYRDGLRAHQVPDIKRCGHDNGRQCSETFAKLTGLMGHYHLSPEKWDPGLLNWKRIMSGLGDVHFPLPVRGYERVAAASPRGFHFLEDEANADAEGLASAFYPIGPGRLWHSGVHLVGTEGDPVHAPLAGTIVAASSGAGDLKAFVLIAHEVQLGGETWQFFSLLAQLADIRSGREQAPWCLDLPQTMKAAWHHGDVVHPGTPVEAGDVIGFVGNIERGPENGPEVHFEIFANDFIKGLASVVRPVDEPGDPVVRFEPLLNAIDGDGGDPDGQVSAAELENFYRSKGRDQVNLRRSLRFVAFRHPHEWSADAREDIEAAPELHGLVTADRHQWFDEVLRPFTFMTTDRADAPRSPPVRLPSSHVVVSYHPITFLMLLAELLGPGRFETASPPLEGRRRPPQLLEQRRKVDAFKMPVRPPSKQPAILARPVFPENRSVRPKTQASQPFDFDLITPD